MSMVKITGYTEAGTLQIEEGDKHPYRLKLPSVLERVDEDPAFKSAVIQYVLDHPRMSENLPEYRRLVVPSATQVVGDSLGQTYDSLTQKIRGYFRDRPGMSIAATVLVPVAVGVISYTTLFGGSSANQKSGTEIVLEEQVNTLDELQKSPQVDASQQFKIDRASRILEKITTNSLSNTEREDYDKLANLVGGKK